MRQQPDRHRVRVALPDHVHVAHRDMHRLAIAHAPRDVHEHAVAQVYGVVEPHDRHAGAMRVRRGPEHALAFHAALRVRAHRSEHVAFAGVRPRDRRERVDVPGRERDPPRRHIPLGADRGDDRVERPGALGPVGRAELLSGHVDHVRGIGECRHRGAILEVRGNRGDAGRVEQRTGLRVRPARHRHHAPAVAQRDRGPSHHPHQRRPHLAAGAEHDHVTRARAERRDDLRRRRREPLLERRDAQRSRRRDRRRRLLLPARGRIRHTITLRLNCNCNCNCNCGERGSPAPG